MGRAELRVQALTKVNSLRSNLRIVVALHSPCALRETGLRMCRPEKSRDGDAIYCRVVRSLQSGLSRKNQKIRACSRILREIEAGILCSADCVAERAVWR